MIRFSKFTSKKDIYEKFEDFRNFVSHDLFESHKSASFVHSCDSRGKVSSESGVYALCEIDMRVPQAIGPAKGIYMRLMQDFLDLKCMHLNYTISNKIELHILTTHTHTNT